MTRIVALDTETTSLRPDRRIWEIGLIFHEEDERRFHCFVDVQDLDLGNADPFALKVGRFYERHPQVRGGDAGALSERAMLEWVERCTRGAHLLGAVPNFDADVLDRRMRAYGIAPSWHYHLIDIEALAVGYLHGLAAHGHSSATCAESPDCERAGEMTESGMVLPWRSDDLSRACGVEPPSDEDRHTALGDARWALRLYEATTGGTP